MDVHNIRTVNLEGGNRWPSRFFFLNFFLERGYCWLLFLFSLFSSFVRSFVRSFVSFSFWGPVAGPVAGRRFVDRGI
jgi:hypothetical protein